MASLTIKGHLENVAAGNASVRDTVEFFLERIQEHSNINAFLEVYSDTARERADQLDAFAQSGESTGRLHGVIIGLKDNICYAGHTVSASSKILNGFISPYSATAVERLLAEGAVIIGRLNCDEFAMGSSNENSAFGPVRNPLDPTRVTGGSSGGSAAAVAAGLCHATLGSDTGGSIRQPASFCGLVGLKPTYGRISRHGLIAYGSSFDQIGPITRNVSDSALLLEVIAGPDEFDSTGSNAIPARFCSDLNLGGKKHFAFLREPIESAGLNPLIKETFLSKIKELRERGHTVDAVDFPFLDFLVPTYYVLTTAEASSNLSRFDGMRYGYRSSNATELESTYKLSRSEGFGPEVKRRIMLGTFVLSEGYYDAYYAKAQRVRRMLRERVEKLFSDYDLILSPTTPDVAFRFGENSADPIKMYLEDIYTVLANLTGHPAVSVPMGKNEEGLPFAMQIMGRMFDEGTVLAAAESIFID
jgi:aspartyl-tRNA(Asn)/glutamyl-tRNA(Gln) amidotransferase subunit A